MPEPWSFAEAREHAFAAADNQRKAEDQMLIAARDAAEAEEAYRVALAKQIVQLHDSEKVAWTVAPDLARGDDHVATLRYRRDLAISVYEAARQALYRCAADRRDVGQLIAWSMRRDLAEGLGDPAWSEAFRDDTLHPRPSNN